MTYTAHKRALIWCAVSSLQQAGVGTVSLDEQERLARELCEERGWDVIEPPIRMAHSRKFYDLEKWAASLRRTGNESGYRLFALWEERGFDVLICHTPDRLGSTSSMIARMIEETVAIDACVHCIRGIGEINATNAPAMISIMGFMTTMRMTRVHELRDVQLDIRAANGAPLQGNTNLTHRIQRGTTKKDDRLVLIEDRVFIWERLAQLVLDGVPLQQLDQELYRRFGIMNPNTMQPWSPGVMRNLLFTPVFWGHRARHHNSRKRTIRNGTWAFDEQSPIPEGIKIWRNTHESALKGELADRVKAELLRRSEIKGRARPRASYRFSGLIVCALCGSRMTVATPDIGSKKTRRRGTVSYYRCATAYANKYVTGQDCTNRVSLPEPKALEDVANILTNLLEQVDPNKYLARQMGSGVIDQITILEKEIANVETRQNRLIDEQASTDDLMLRQKYRTKIAGYEDQLRVLRNELAELMRQADSEETRRTRSYALDEIRTIGVIKFLNDYPALEVNQILRRVLGPIRFYALGAKIVGYNEWHDPRKRTKK